MFMAGPNYLAVSEAAIVDHTLPFFWKNDKEESFQDPKLISKGTAQCQNKLTVNWFV